MKKFLFILLFYSTFTSFSYFINRTLKGEPGLPVFVSYHSNEPPDSIKDYVNAYLKSKKVRIIKTREELRALVEAEIKSMTMRVINNGNISPRDIRNMANYLDPVGTVLAMDFYKSNPGQTTFTIDSIYWKSKAVPGRDTIWDYKGMFVPDSVSRLTTKSVLKSFIDKILSSGYLR
jgi:hypothetical protein